MSKTTCNKGDTFNVDSEVPCSGGYICVPCGDKKHFSEGEVFPRCSACIEKKGNPDKLRKGLGLWELLEPRDATHKCPECGLHYRDEQTAKTCQTWCAENHSCNLDIIKHSIEQETVHI